MELTKSRARKIVQFAEWHLRHETGVVERLCEQMIPAIREHIRQNPGTPINEAYFEKMARSLKSGGGFSKLSKAPWNYLIGILLVGTIVLFTYRHMRHVAPTVPAKRGNVLIMHYDLYDKPKNTKANAEDKNFYKNFTDIYDKYLLKMKSWDIILLPFYPNSVAPFDKDIEFECPNNVKIWIKPDDLDGSINTYLEDRKTTKNLITILRVRSKFNKTLCGAHWEYLLGDIGDGSDEAVRKASQQFENVYEHIKTLDNTLK